MAFCIELPYIPRTLETHQNIKNPLYDALDIIGVMICAKFYNNRGTPWLTVCVPIENWGPIFGIFLYILPKMRA